MIGFINTLVTHSLLITLKYTQYSAIADLHTSQFTVAYALGSDKRKTQLALCCIIVASTEAFLSNALTCCREVFSAVLRTNERSAVRCGPARPGSARLGSARHGTEKTPPSLSSRNHPRTGLDDVKKRKFLPHRDSNCDPLVVQPVASRYTSSH
jgi:hypothetical protein